MAPKLVLFAVIIGITWLFLKDRKRRKPASAALWLPLIWVFIIGSRPISAWFGAGHGLENAVDYMEGSPLDRAVFFGLIAAGLVVLVRRRQSWGSVVWENKWLFGFYLYLALSVLWSDYPYVSFKRWIKDFGNIVMALVVLSELKPWDAFKLVFMRATYLLVPLSVVVIKYFPDTGRYYDPWTYRVRFSGLSEDKNLLGMTLFVCGLFLFDRFIDAREKLPAAEKGPSRLILIAFLLMTLWLLIKAQSVTAIVCIVFSATILWVLRRYGAKRLFIWALVIAVPAMFLSSVFGIADLAGTLLGRDTTLTGRTEIWRILLKEQVNPLFGAGFYSFWLGERSARISEQYYFILNEAHNGYLEAYLNTGLLGLSLLLALLGVSARSQWRNFKNGIPEAAFRLSFLMGTIVYNITEAPFNRLSIIWFTFLLIVVVYRRPHEEFQVQDAAGRIRHARVSDTTVLSR